MVNDSGEKIIGEILLREWLFEVRRYFLKIWVVIYGRKFSEKRL